MKKNYIVLLMAILFFSVVSELQCMHRKNISSSCRVKKSYCPKKKIKKVTNRREKRVAINQKRLLPSLVEYFLEKMRERDRLEKEYAVKEEIAVLKTRDDRDCWLGCL